MVTSHTLTGDLSDLVGTDFPRNSVWVTIRTNLGDADVRDSTGNQVRLPRHRFALAADGTFSKSLWSTAALTNPTGYQYQVEVEYPDGPGASRKARWTSGWFSLTADTDLADLAYDPLVPPEYYPELLLARDEAVTARDEAETAQAAAEAAQAAAEAVGNTNDTIMAAVAADPESDFYAVQSASFARVFTPEAYGAVGDGTTDDTAAIQAALDAASTAGGGTVLLSAKDYLVTKPVSEASNFHALSMSPNTRLAGITKAVSRIVLAADMTGATAPNVFTVVRLGDGNTGVTNVAVEDIGFVGRNSTKGFGAGFGSQIAIAANHNLTKTATTTRVRVRRCDFQDWQIAVRSHKNPGDGEETTTPRLDSQFRDWVIEDCTGDLFGNKVVELSECRDGVITRNRFTRCTDGPQAIFYSSNIEISYNRVTYTATGINVAAGSHDIDIVGNLVEADPTISTGSAGAALQIRSEPVATTWRVYNIRSRGNVYRDAYTTAGRAFRLATRAEPLSEEYDSLFFEGDTFDGDVTLYAVTNASHTTLHGVRFRNCRIKKFTTVSYATSAVWDIAFDTCDIYGPVSSVQGTGVRATGCSWAATPIVVAGASSTVLQNNAWPTTLSDAGTSTTAANNVTVPPLPGGQDPMAYLGSVVSVFEADDLAVADGADVTSWSPKAGGSESSVLTPRTATNPTMVASAINGHKAVRNGSAARLYTATPWSASSGQPLTLAVVFKADADTGAAQHIIGGLSASQPSVRVNADDKLGVGGTSAVTTVDSASAIGYGSWHVAVIVLTSTASKMFFDTTTRRSQSAATNNLMTGLSLFSTGSGNSPYLVGEIAYMGIAAREASDSEAALVLSSLANKYGLSLTA